MGLTLEQWDQTLNVAESNNSSDILEQIKVKLLKQDKDTYAQWKRENFSENYLFDVLFIDGRLRFKCTLLCLAALSGHLDIVKYFVDEKKVDINQANNDGRTALHLAAENGNLETVKYLVEKGADVCKKDNCGLTALDLAKNSGKTDVVKFLSNKETKGNKLPIITACTGLLLGLGIAYLIGAAALTSVVATIAVFVAAAAVGALVGYGVGRFCEKVSEERQKDRHMSIGTAIKNVLTPECLKSQEIHP